MTKAYHKGAAVNDVEVWGEGPCRPVTLVTVALGITLADNAPPVLARPHRHSRPRSPTGKPTHVPEQAYGDGVAGEAAFGGKQLIFQLWQSLLS